MSAAQTNTFNNNNNLASPNECRQCFNKDELQFEEDQRTADLICMRCGFVANRIVSEETDWRDFEEDAVSKSRVGAAHSIYGESKLETQVAGYNKGCAYVCSVSCCVCSVPDARRQRLQAATDWRRAAALRASISNCRTRIQTTSPIVSVLLKWPTSVNWMSL